MCGRRLIEVGRAPVCRSCLGSLESIETAEWCDRCALPLRGATGPVHGSDCARCGLPPAAFEVARAGGPYQGRLQQVIRLLKYGGMRPLADPLAGALRGRLGELGPIGLIVPVPLHWKRRLRRGFNQSALIARGLARAAGLECAPQVLRRVRGTRSQAGLSRTERRENVRGAFTVSDPCLVRGRDVALIDDVMTTGATLDACARELKRAGARRVAALTAARAELIYFDRSETGDASVYPVEQET